jgi:hypothetical protein
MKTPLKIGSDNEYLRYSYLSKVLEYSRALVPERLINI